MKLGSGLRHLRRKHYDCWSCKLEQLLLRAVMEGRGQFMIGDPLDDKRS